MKEEIIPSPSEFETCKMQGEDIPPNTEQLDYKAQSLK